MRSDRYICDHCFKEIHKTKQVRTVDVSKNGNPAWYHFFMSPVMGFKLFFNCTQEWGHPERVDLCLDCEIELVGKYLENLKEAK